MTSDCEHLERPRIPAGAAAVAARWIRSTSSSSPTRRTARGPAGCCGQRHSGVDRAGPVDEPADHHRQRDRSGRCDERVAPNSPSAIGEARTRTAPISARRHDRQVHPAHTRTGAGAEHRGGLPQPVVGGPQHRQDHPHHQRRDHHCLRDRHQQRRTTAGPAAASPARSGNRSPRHRADPQRQHHRAVQSGDRPPGRSGLRGRRAKHHRQQDADGPSRARCRAPRPAASCEAPWCPAPAARCARPAVVSVAIVVQSPAGRSPQRTDDQHRHRRHQRAPPSEHAHGGRQVRRRSRSGSLRTDAQPQGRLGAAAQHAGDTSTTITSSSCSDRQHRRGPQVADLCWSAGRSRSPGWCIAPRPVPA